MGFKKRMRTTGKVEIPEGARKEAELLYLHNIVTIVEKYEIPHSLIMNLDQTPLKYYVLVPNNMTQLFQPLDLTVKKHCKSYLKCLFPEWFAKQIENQLSLRKNVE